jgi:hypothetical protein
VATGASPVVYVRTAALGYPRSSEARQLSVASGIYFDSARSSENAPAPRNNSAAAMAIVSR